jgi:hypothetical protein
MLTESALPGTVPLLHIDAVFQSPETPLSQEIRAMRGTVAPGWLTAGERLGGERPRKQDLLF